MVFGNVSGRQGEQPQKGEWLDKSKWLIKQILVCQMSQKGSSLVSWAVKVTGSFPHNIPDTDDV